MKNYDDEDFKITFESIDGKIFVHHSYKKWSPFIYKRFLKIIAAIACENNYPVIFCSIAVDNAVTHKYVQRVGFKKICFITKPELSLLYKVDTKCFKQLKKLQT